mgnify:CR=1 FL=1
MHAGLSSAVTAGLIATARFAAAHGRDDSLPRVALYSRATRPSATFARYLGDLHPSRDVAQVGLFSKGCMLMLVIYFVLWPAIYMSSEGGLNRVRTACEAAWLVCGRPAGNTYIHTCVHAYVRTYVHTYAYTYVARLRPPGR